MIGSSDMRLGESGKSRNRLRIERREIIFKQPDIHTQYYTLFLCSHIRVNMNESIASLQDAFKWLIISFLTMYNEDLAREIFHDLNSPEVNGDLIRARCRFSTSQANRAYRLELMHIDL